MICFGELPVPPQAEKQQLVPKPPTYEESLADILEGNKEIYVDPQYFPDPQELPDLNFTSYMMMRILMIQFLYEGDRSRANMMLMMIFMRMMIMI